MMAWYRIRGKLMTTNPNWTPAVELDLAEASAAAMASTVNEFKAKFAGIPQIPTGLKDGWHVITPQIAENLLRHNAGNRKVSVQTVQYYARQMLSGEWKKTGQPIILNDMDQMIDAQHRSWAGYLSNTPFESYVVTNVPMEEHLFAFIDNGKVRSAGDALSTAGMNGLASVVAAAVRVAQYYDQGALTVMKKLFVPRLSPIEAIRYAEAHPQLAEAAHLQIGEYKAATSLIGYRDVAVFAAWKIVESFGTDVLDEFMGKLGGSEPAEDGSAPALLRKKYLDNANSDEPMPKHHTLGYLTKAFNAYRLQQPMRRLFLKTDEKWPLFVDDAVDVEVAA